MGTFLEKTPVTWRKMELGENTCDLEKDVVVLGTWVGQLDDLLWQYVWHQLHDLLCMYGINLLQIVSRSWICKRLGSLRALSSTRCWPGWPQGKASQTEADWTVGGGHTSPAGQPQTHLQSWTQSFDAHPSSGWWPSYRHLYHQQQHRTPPRNLWFHPFLGIGNPKLDHNVQCHTASGQPQECLISQHMDW